MSIGTLVDGRFRLEAVAGSGGMGAVYRALDTTTGEPVALKLLHPHAYHEVARFTREAQALALVDHPNIVRYVAHGTLDAGMPYLAMEWLDGENLYQRLERGPLPLADAVTLCATVAAALHSAHRRGLVHRDVKPGNLILCGPRPESVKVVDFGIVRWNSRSITATGAAFGTPGYMAPEQARGAGNADARADIFSLGCVLFEAASGVPVFTGENVMAVLTKVMLEEPPALSDVLPGAPPALEDLVARMLAKDPAARPEDAGAVSATLSALELAAGPPSMAPSRRRQAVTEGELRIVSLVLARSCAPPGPEPTAEAAAALLDSLRAAVWPHGERLEILRDGSVLVVPGSSGSARDQANQAARCALALRGELPDWAASIGSGRAESKGARSLGEAVDRASRALGGPGTIHIDDVTAALIDPRFEVREGPGGLLLERELAQTERMRTLLGKPTPCVGRDADLAALTGYLDDCIAQPKARPILVTGPPGIGKSRVRAELLRTVRARTPSVAIWMARADPVSAGSPYAMVAAAVRRAGGLEGAPPEVARERIRALASRHVPEAERGRVCEFLGELLDVPSLGEGSIQLRAARRDPALMGDQMTRALCDLLEAECAAHPVLLVLEDLHWGDLPSVKAIDAALRLLRDRPLMVLALARAEVHELFPRLWSARGLVEAPLSELGANAGEDLVRSVLGDAVDQQAARRLVERSAGNPFFLEELIRAAARGGPEATLPETVLGVVEGRLEQLSPEARRVLRAASVFGLVAWSGAIGALVGDARVALRGSAPLDELLDHELIHRRAESRFPGELEYVFHHAVVREAAYSMLTADDRRVGHRLAAEWLEKAGEHDSALLAQHLEAGGERERAVAHYERAAAHALQGNDFDAVRARVERAIACGASGETLGVVRLLEARAFGWTGRMEDGRRAADAALLHLPERTPAWYDAVGLIATTANAAGDTGRVEEVALLLDHDMPAAAGTAWLTACSWVATNMIFGDRIEAARALVARLDQVSEAVLANDPVGKTALLAVRVSWAKYVEGGAGQASLTRQSIDGFEALGNERSAALSRVNLAWTLNELGAFEEAEALAREAMIIGERLALGYVEHGARYCCGRALMQLGRWEDARGMLERASSAFEAGANRRHAGAARLAIVDLLLLMGDVEAAEAEVERAIALVEQLPPFLALALAMRAEIRLRQGRRAEALADAGEAFAPLELGERAVEGEARIRLVHAEALHASGIL